MELASCIKAVATASSQYSNNRSNSNLSYLLHQLEVLKTIVSRSESLKALHPNDVLTHECLSCLTDLIGDVACKQTVVFASLNILTDLAKKSELCNMMKESFSMDHALAGILKTFGGSPDDQMTTVCINLLQMVTYGHHVALHENFVDDLVKYLISLSSPDEQCQSCLGTLANLCHHNTPVQMLVKSNDSIQRLYKALCKLFNHDNLTFAVFAISAFTSLCLTEELGEKVFFKSQNIKLVVQVLFNALMFGNTANACFYAADLLQEMLVNPRMQAALGEYHNLPKCIEDTLTLISSCSPTSVAKVFELLISFCTLKPQRSFMCRRLFDHIITSEQQLSIMSGQLPRSDFHPLLATVYWSVLPLTRSQHASRAALDFLTEMYEELVCHHDNSLASGLDLVLQPLVRILIEPLSFEDPYIKAVCLRLSSALRLLTAMCEDVDLRLKVSKSVDVKDFEQLLQFHIDGNGAVQKQTFILSSQGKNWGWRDVSVEVVLQALNVMSRLQNTVDGLDRYLGQVLQDNRLVPFLAKAWTSRDRKLVQLSLHLTCLGKSLDNFPAVILGEAVAALNISSSASCPDPSSLSMDVSCSSYVTAQSACYGEDRQNVPARSCRTGGGVEHECAVDESVQMLIDKVHSSMELKDLKNADMIGIYEHRLHSYQMKEDNLQDLLDAKSQALLQADRLIAQYRSRQGRHGAEAHKMRCLFQEAERNNDTLLQEVSDLKLERDRLKDDFDSLKHEKNQLELKALDLEELKLTHADLSEKFDEQQSVLTRQQQELNSRQDELEMLQKHHESLRQRNDAASEQVRKLEDERKQLSRVVKDKEGKLQETCKALQSATDQNRRLLHDKEELEVEKESLDKSLDMLRENIAAAELAVRQLTQKNQALDRLSQEQEEMMRSARARVVCLEGEVNKHEHIAALIQQLSSGKKVPLPE